MQLGRTLHIYSSNAQVTACSPACIELCNYDHSLQLGPLCKLHLHSRSRSIPQKRHSLLLYSESPSEIGFPLSNRDGFHLARTQACTLDRKNHHGRYEVLDDKGDPLRSRPMLVLRKVNPHTRRCLETTHNSQQPNDQSCKLRSEKLAENHPYTARCMGGQVYTPHCLRHMASCGECLLLYSLFPRAVCTSTGSAHCIHNIDHSSLRTSRPKHLCYTSPKVLNLSMKSIGPYSHYSFFPIALPPCNSNRGLHRHKQTFQRCCTSSYAALIY
mmetsp:Transcript_30301/g.48925  ORF Transcript_30301/g.48925 Transcript_30301/m.48925 type:complete len:271 (-) Transcript_30301:368-1180(-)